MSKFIDTLGPYTADEDLCLREFSKSLCNHAYTWYIGLKLGSIPTWDDMVDVFYTKYFHGEETVTLATLQAIKQKNEEDLMEYIKRFRDIALDCYDYCEEKTLVEMCMTNMIREYRAILENLEISQWIANGVFKPNQVAREPTEEERRDPHFCRLHDYVQHPTTECCALLRLVHRRIKEGTLELTQQEVQRNPLPNHKGKGMAAVVICADLGEDEEENPTLPTTTITTLQKSSKFKNLFDQLGLTAKERKIATEALVRASGQE
ncbi:uncharacterized protein LOC142617604 [Castanea sativa]|uniref:uncharacterized protein LOC142617604 n=1 Tax=Castanea sativa TaxID=21020 RepID=UPI003F64C9E9